MNKKNLIKTKLINFYKTEPFIKVWNGFVNEKVIDDDELSLKQICGIFFGLGVIDVLEKKFDDTNEINKGILLGEESFKCLVRGGVIHSGKIRISLSDIGFEKMLEAIKNAVNDNDINVDHIIQEKFTE